MAKMQQYNGKIQIVKRLNNSVNGNPKFLVELCDLKNYETLETKAMLHILII